VVHDDARQGWGARGECSRRGPEYAGGLDNGYDERIDDYEYDNPAEQLRPRRQPTQAELDAL